MTLRSEKVSLFTLKELFSSWAKSRRSIIKFLAMFEVYIKLSIAFTAVLVTVVHSLILLLSYFIEDLYSSTWTGGTRMSFKIDEGR
jgi:hypothetical protein